MTTLLRGNTGSITIMSSTSGMMKCPCPVCFKPPGYGNGLVCYADNDAMTLSGISREWK